MNKKTTYLFEMHCCVNSPGQKSSFPSQYTFIFAGPLLPNRFLSCEPPLFFNLLTADCPADYCEYLRKAKLSERGTKCRAKENGKGRNRYHVTSLMWTATAGDESEIAPGLFRLPRPGPEPQLAQTTSCLAQSCCHPEVHVISVTSCGAHCTKAVHREPHFGPRKYRFPSTFVAKLRVNAQNI